MEPLEPIQKNTQNELELELVILPAVSAAALKVMGHRVRSWRIHMCVRDHLK
jgi:hypothetical protein